MLETSIKKKKEKKVPPEQQDVVDQLKNEIKDSGVNEETKEVISDKQLFVKFNEDYNKLIPEGSNLSASEFFQALSLLYKHDYLKLDHPKAKQIQEVVQKKISLLQEQLLPPNIRESIAQDFQSAEDPFDTTVVVDSLYTHVFNAPESEVSAETKTAIAKKYGIAWTASNLKEQLAEGKAEVQVGTATVSAGAEGAGSGDMEVKIPAKNAQEKELTVKLPNNPDTKEMREQMNTVQLYKVLESFGLHEILLAGLNLREGDQQLKPHHIEQAQRIYSLVLGPSKSAGEFRSPQELARIEKSLYFLCKDGKRSLSQDRARENLKELGLLKTGERRFSDENTDLDLIMAYAGDNLEEAKTTGYETARYILTGNEGSEKKGVLQRIGSWFSKKSPKGGTDPTTISGM
jgi:hypothetical protein